MRTKCGVVTAREPENVTAVYADIPQYAKDALYRMILRDVERMFENPEIQAEFEEWKKNRNGGRKDGQDKENCYGPDGNN